MKVPTFDRVLAHKPTIETWMRGDQVATAFVLEVSRIIHVWDDLIDKDNEITPDDINEAFWSLFFILPNNEFYLKHFNRLNPLLMAAEINWRTANKLESAGGKKNYQIAYIVRSSYADVITMAASLVGGRQWAYEVAPYIRHWVHAESFEDYMSDFTDNGES